MDVHLLKSHEHIICMCLLRELGLLLALGDRAVFERGEMARSDLVGSNHARLRYTLTITSSIAWTNNSS